MEDLVASNFSKVSLAIATILALVIVFIFNFIVSSKISKQHRLGFKRIANDALAKSSITLVGGAAGLAAAIYMTNANKAISMAACGAMVSTGLAAIWVALKNRELVAQAKANPKLIAKMPNVDYYASVNAGALWTSVAFVLVGIAGTWITVVWNESFAGMWLVWSVLLVSAVSTARFADVVPSVLGRL